MRPPHFIDSGILLPQQADLAILVTTRRFVCLSLLLAWGCNPRLSLADERIDWATNSAAEAACERQLNRIHGAIQEYQKRNHDLPHWLSELVPEFIHDPNTLVCPYARRTWTLKSLGRVFRDPRRCSYGYEFCSEKWNVPSSWTTRTYKERQMEVLGFGVPIVRCFAHRPLLNLGFDGSIYLSRGEWEDSFVTSMNYRRFLHSFWPLTNITESKLIAKLSEPRKPGTDPRLLDLSTEYNATLLHLSQMDRSGKLLITYPEGTQKIGGIDFDARALVHLTARQFPIAFPEKVESIPVNRQCTFIHFLHGVTSSAANGTRVASFIVRFRDGQTNEIPIIYGTDVKARWFDRRRESEQEDPKPAWVTPPEKVGSTGKSLRLYTTSWKNEARDSEIASIDFISDMTESAPFLLAITVE